MFLQLTMIQKIGLDDRKTALRARRKNPRLKAPLKNESEPPNKQKYVPISGYSVISTWSRFWAPFSWSHLR
jgi:hypothetical protein